MKRHKRRSSSKSRQPDASPQDAGLLKVKPDWRVATLATLVVLLVLSAVAGYIFVKNRARTASVGARMEKPTRDVGPDAPLADFKVVNAHEHLYKRAHLDKYLRAAEKTGIARTLFVASSEYTFAGKEGRRDALNDWSSMEIINASREFPDKIIPFCAIYPGDPDKLEKLKGFVQQGAKGLKLYTGHPNFYENRPLDTPDMSPIYAYCEETRLPVCWHVSFRNYEPEFRRVMQQYPRLIVIIPHFGVTFFQPREAPFRRFQKLLDDYPTLYTDTSFGTREILVQGLYAIGRDPELFRAFFQKYSDRILFGTDMVVTGNSEKTEEWIELVIRACRDALEKETFYFPLAANGAKYAQKGIDNPKGEFRGFALPDEILRKVYETNIEKLFGS